MKNILILSGIVVVMLSCNSDRIAELETENTELKTSIELCQQEAQQQKELALIARMRAETAIGEAEKQRRKAIEAAANN